ncbi:MAG: hypothetical protein ACD_19C00176G0012 [uncultured bacterium]|nr:MAG: hypothetical protein ACD_19C00176G0012 [uncultured bacterium]
MAKKQINLISQEMTVPTKIVVLAKVLNKISIIGTIFLILAAIGLISGLLYFNSQYKKTISNIDSLKVKITDLEESEQKLILAKNKLSKIAYIRSINSIDNELDNYNALKNQILINSVSFDTAEVIFDPNKTETSFKFSDTTNLSNALTTLSKFDKYKKIILTSLGYNTTSGYLINLIFSN